VLPSHGEMSENPSHKHTLPIKTNENMKKNSLQLGLKRHSCHQNKNAKNLVLL
jgi:hypothetical protein